MTTASQTFSNQTTYTSQEYTANGKRVVIIEAKGKFNYVNVTINPRGRFPIPGKDYANFDAARAAYKSGAMLGVLLIAEAEFNSL